MASDPQGQLLPFFTAMEHQGRIIVSDVPKLDLELYLSNYTGRSRFERLLLIGQCCVPLCLDALKAAITEAKKGKDVHRYQDACDSLRLAAPHEPEARYDEAWANATTRANNARTHQLESELKEYKNNLVKESIRIGYRDLGEHLESIGNLNGATDAYVKMRPESGTGFHISEYSKHMIGVMLQRQDWSGIAANINKQVGAGDGGAERPYYQTVGGIAYLSTAKYAEAAKLFLEAGDLSTCKRFSDVASPNDVAIYGALLALATMDRKQLQRKVLDNPSFRACIELEPQIRKAVSMFVNCRYSACLEILEANRSDWLLDIYLQKHVPEILSLVRKKCIIQYTVPFKLVKLETMNGIFGRPGESIEEELASMIKSKALNARINAIDKHLVMVQEDPRATMQADALAMVKKYERDAVERLRRMSIAAASLELKGTGRKGGGGDAGDLPGFSDILHQEHGASAAILADELT
ncbi:26S proteasome subunit RPN7-domain-containing protein [Astrocystis sublimbata]|nr:26S proteasome subunit RPN7-domain-containing protein [Astrocystis sublimbata]